jgi:hypothetical protein
MPSNIVKTFAEKSGKSTDEVEKLWNKAKGVVSKGYPNVKKESDKWYALVTGTLKQMVGLKESTLLAKLKGSNNMENNESTFTDLVEEEISNLEKLAEGKCGGKKKMKEEEGDKEEMEKDDSDEEVEDEEGDGKKKKKKKDAETDDSDEEVEKSEE